MTIDRKIRSPLAVIVLAAVVAVVATTSPAAAQQEAPVPGEFLGADLITEDAAAATAFYSALFGWDIEKVEEGGYAIDHKGRLIASISQIEDDTEVDKSFWLVGIAVADVDDAVRAATANGAEVHEKPQTVADYGRFAVIGDPRGAPLMLIEPGATRIGGTTGAGAWVWAEFWADDPKAAGDFYAEVLGYDLEKVERDGKPYGVFMAGGKGRTGLVQIPAEFENVKPGWAPYVGVDSLKSAMVKVVELGGKVVFGHQEEETKGRVALILDPAGAALFIYEIGTHQGAE